MGGKTLSVRKQTTAKLKSDIARRSLRSGDLPFCPSLLVPSWFEQRLKPLTKALAKVLYVTLNTYPLLRSYSTVGPR